MRLLAAGFGQFSFGVYTVTKPIKILCFQPDVVLFMDRNRI